MKRIAVAVVVLITSAACSDATGPTYPNVRGDYVATYRYVEIDHSTGQSATVVCNGAISITSQNRGQFSGTFAVQPTGACHLNYLGTLSGDVDATGHITFRTSESGTSKNAVAMMTSCPVSAGSDQFQGIILQSTMTVSMAATVKCSSGTASVWAELQWHIVAGKT